MDDTVKKLQTRIKLKYDTLANWTSNNPVLLKGEVAFVEVPTGSTEATQPPAIMFKVGDGTSAFNSLQWGSGKAADVYAWAKKTGIEIDSTSSTGAFVTGISWDGISNKLKIERADNISSSDGTVSLSMNDATVKVGGYLEVSSDIIADGYVQGATGLYGPSLRKDDASDSNALTVPTGTGDSTKDILVIKGDLGSLASKDSVSENELESALKTKVSDAYSNANTAVTALNGHTVGVDVPADAKFTDTTYSAGTNVSIDGSNVISVSGASSVSATSGSSLPTNNAVIAYVGKAISEQSNAYVIDAEVASTDYYNSYFKVEKTSTVSKVTISKDYPVASQGHINISTTSDTTVNLASAKVGDMILTIPGTGDKAYKDWWIASIETTGTAGDYNTTIICYQLDSDTPVLTEYVNQMNGASSDSKGSKDASTKFISYIQKEGGNLIVQEQSMPTTMKSPHSLTIGSMSYDGSAAKTVSISGSAVASSTVSGNQSYTINHATNAFSVKTKVGSAETEVSRFAQTADKTLKFIQGDNITLTPDATNGTITIAAASDTNTWRPISFGSTSLGDADSLKFEGGNYTSWNWTAATKTAVVNVNTANFAMTTDNLIIDCGTSSTNLFTE